MQEQLYAKTYLRIYATTQKSKSAITQLCINVKVKLRK